ATAMTGNMEAGVLGAMRGHQLGKSAADKTMNFASGLYSYMSPYRGGQAPYDILSPLAENRPASPRLPQSPANVLLPGMSPVSQQPANVKPKTGNVTSSGGMGV